MRHCAQQSHSTIRDTHTQEVEAREDVEAEVEVEVKVEVGVGHLCFC